MKIIGLFVLSLCFISEICGLNQPFSLGNRAKIVRSNLADIYKGIESKTVDTIAISDDLDEIYYRVNPITFTDSNGNRVLQSDDEVETMGVVHVAKSNPLLTDRILDYSQSHQVYTTFVEVQHNPIQTVLSEGFQIVSSLFPLFFVYILIRSFFVGAGGNLGPMGQGLRSPLKPVGKKEDRESMKKANISLSSWAGSQEVFEECAEIVSFLRNVTQYEAVGAEVPKGVLLEGPPGTGKTLLAKALASEADANFFSVSGSEFIELYVGLGAAKVRDLFEKARTQKPSIIFIDEIDAIGKQRGSSNGNFGGNDEREQTLNQILAEMDGFTDNRGVIVVAATNRRDILDAALLRPGRFDRILSIPLPDKKSRRAILGVHVRNKTIESAIDYEFLAEATAGFSGAQIKNLINEGAIYAARSGNRTISQANLEDALEKTVIGIAKKTDERSDTIRRRVAVHETGHALLAKYFSENFILKKVTIQATYEGAGGYTLFNQNPEVVEGGLYTKEMLCQNLIIALGGKAAENIYYGPDKMSLGAIQDLKQANSLARNMVEKYGMGGRHWAVFYKTDTYSDIGEAFNSYSEVTKEAIDDGVSELVYNAYCRAIHILKENRNATDTLVEQLLAKTTVAGDDVNL